MLIANVLSRYADYIFDSDIQSLDSFEAWLGTLAYTFQIYFDFSGYSDMAIGFGKIMGFNFPENFNNPYISQNISEFWRRWHITLGRWMKYYLYIPLGINKVKTEARLYFNLIFVFFVSGLWHGAAWNFVIWGLYHGVFLILDRIFLVKILQKAGKYISILFTFFVTIIGWVIFRLENLDDIMLFYKKMFSFKASSIIISDIHDIVIILIVAVIFSFITLFKYGLKIEELVFCKEYSKKLKFVLFIGCLILLLLSLGSIAGSKFNPFIYFRF